MILLSAGSTATLECSTTGVPTPTVSWQFEGASVDTSLSKVSLYCVYVAGISGKISFSDFCVQLWW